MAGRNLPPYGNAIQQARESGDLDEMKKVAADAEAYLDEHGDLPRAYEELQAAIAKREAG